MTHRLLLLTLLSFLVHQLYATDYYVSKSGDDSNLGTLESPFLTVTKAASIMQPGDNCFIREGIYRETLSPENSGTADNPITFSNYLSEKAIISATDILSNWTQHEGDVYKTTANLDLGVERNALFYNSELLDIARWPNNTDLDRFTLESQEVVSGTANSIKSENLPAIDWTNGYIYYMGAHSGMSWTRPITSSTSNEINYTEVDITKWPFNPHNPTIYRNENYGRFFLFGVLEALDAPGEWFYEETSNTVYLIAPDGSIPQSENIEATARENTVSIGDKKHYIIIDGIDFFGGEVVIEGDNCTLKNSTLTHCYSGLDDLENSSAQITRGAIRVEGKYILIEKNLIDHSTANGVVMTSRWKDSHHNTIQNNVIRNVNTIGIHSNGIRSSCDDVVISNNTIYSCGRDGIYLSGQNGEISYNDVSDCMKLNNDGGVFYTVGNTELKNNNIHHNWFHHSYGPEYADGRAAGIYLDNNSKGYNVHHNLVWEVTWAALQINWENHELYFYNNTLWEVGEAMGRWENGYNLEDIRVYNNLCNTIDWIGTDIQNNKVIATDPFISIADSNFVPQQGMGIIDAGMIIAPFTDGFLGDAPDIGAYESGKEPWTAGADWFTYSPPPLSAETPKQANKNSLHVYPNPTKGDCFIHQNSEVTDNCKINVYTIDGRLVMTQYIEAQEVNNYAINTQDLPTGIYLLNLESGDQILQTKLKVID